MGLFSIVKIRRGGSLLVYQKQRVSNTNDAQVEELAETFIPELRRARAISVENACC